MQSSSISSVKGPQAEQGHPCQRALDACPSLRWHPGPRPLRQERRPIHGNMAASAARASRTSPAATVGRRQKQAAAPSSFTTTMVVRCIFILKVPQQGGPLRASCPPEAPP